VQCASLCLLWAISGPLVIRHTDKAARSCAQPHFRVTAAQAILKNLGWGFCSMAKLIFGLNQSLDGYVDHDHQAFAPGPALFRHFIEQVCGLSGSVYGRRMYEVMRYWDEDRPEWGRGGARLRRGVAEPTEVGRVALAEVSRPQRHTCRR
jgi:hypothetical protein